LAPATNSFCPGAGGMLCPNCHQNQISYSVSAKGLDGLQLLQSNDYDTASQLEMNPKVSNEIEGVMRNYLKYLLEREIKSTAWLDTLRAQKATLG
ncbi:unnamed protein product, partial [marine sediment metagenome]